MKYSMLKTFVAAVVSVLLAGCGTPSVKQAYGPEAAVAYGNITLPAGNITKVMLYKVGEVYAPPFKSPPEGHAYTNGNFFFENLEPGKYFLMGFMSGQEAFYFNYRGMSEEQFIKKAAVNVKPGGVVYLGSYKVTGIDRNFIRSDTFDIKRSETPGRDTILGHLIEATKGTDWESRFRKAMK